VRPLLHFLAIGALLFAGARWMASSPPLAARDASEEALLASEARRLGIDRDDPVVRGRLVRNLQLARGDAASPEALYGEALSLGMDRSDWVVERRLAERMAARLRAEGAEQPVSDEALRSAFDRHRDVWERPATVQISHLFFSHARRGADADSDARAALSALRAARLGPDAAAGRGDPFLLGGDLPPRSADELARGFGPRFAAAVAALEPGAWSEPIESSYGLHLVWVRARAPAEPADFERVRPQVEDVLRSERGEAALRAALRRLRAGAGS